LEYSKEGTVDGVKKIGKGLAQKSYSHEGAVRSGKPWVGV